MRRKIGRYSFGVNFAVEPAADQFDPLGAVAALGEQSWSVLPCPVADSCGVEQDVTLRGPEAVIARLVG